MEVRIPNNWNPRPHQLRLWEALEAGIKRAVAVWHRRAGKDSTAINWTATAMLERPGNYWHLLPEQSQGRKAIWNAIDNQGRRIIDQAFPLSIRKRTLDQDMFIELVNGSTWQVLGSDNFNSLIGSNPVGVVFSEYSVANPAAWDYLRPILAAPENGGWALFIYTSRGDNHGKDLYQMAVKNQNWFAQILTVDDTGLLSPDVIQEERNSGMSEDMIQQEYYCSFNGSVVGAYYGKLMQDAKNSERILDIQYNPAVPVETWWDLGVGDATAIWFVQRVNREIRLIDYYEATGEGLPHYAKMLQGKPYIYSRHVMPHDVEVRELGTGKSRKEMAEALSIKPIVVAPRLSIDDGINAVRVLLPLCWFDETRCKDGIKALINYKKVWDEKNKTFRDSPHHDWTSHCADAFRMGAVMPDIKPVPKVKPFIARAPQSNRPGSWVSRI